MRRWPLRLAVLVVIAGNAIALGEVAWNRAAVVQRITLAETELPYTITHDEDSMTSLRLSWITETYGLPATDGLTEAQLRAAGFPLPPVLPADIEASQPEPREAFAVLEFDGERFHRWLAAYRARQSSSPPGPTSRLLLIDVGRDPAALRAQYPDGSRYLIVRCVLHAALEYPSIAAGRQWRGYVSEVLPEAVHVPRELARELRRATDTQNSVHYAVTLCFGRRDEPWVESVAIR